MGHPLSRGAGRATLDRTSWQPTSPVPHRSNRSKGTAMVVALPTALATSQGGCLHRRQLRAAGLSRHVIARRVKHGELIEIASDVFLVGGTTPTWDQRLWSALLTARSGAVVSHRAGSHLHGAGRFGERFVDILERENTEHRISHGHAHRTSWLPPEHVTTVRGIPVTTLPRTIFDLAGLASRRRWERGWPSITEHQAARVLDDAIGMGLPVTAVEDVLETMAQRGRPGTVLTRKLLAERGVGYVATESDLEDLLHQVLDHYDLPLPSRQRWLGDASTPIGRVDFVYLDLKIVIEADGRANHTALLDAEHDRWRDLELAAAGWTVVRVTWKQLSDEPGRFVRSLRKLLGARSTG